MSSRPSSADRKVFKVHNIRVGSRHFQPVPSSRVLLVSTIMRRRPAPPLRGRSFGTAATPLAAGGGIPMDLRDGLGAPQLESATSVGALGLAVGPTAVPRDEVLVLRGYEEAEPGANNGGKPAQLTAAPAAHPQTQPGQQLQPNHPQPGQPQQPVPVAAAAAGMATTTIIDSTAGGRRKRSDSGAAALLSLAGPPGASPTSAAAGTPAPGDQSGYRVPNHPGASTQPVQMQGQVVQAAASSGGEAPEEAQRRARDLLAVNGGSSSSSQAAGVANVAAATGAIGQPPEAGTGVVASATGAAAAVGGGAGTRAAEVGTAASRACAADGGGGKKTMPNVMDYAAGFILRKSVIVPVLRDRDERTRTWLREEHERATKEEEEDDRAAVEEARAAAAAATKAADAGGAEQGKDATQKSEDDKKTDEGGAEEKQDGNGDTDAAMEDAAADAASAPATASPEDTENSAAQFLSSLGRGSSVLLERRTCSAPTSSSSSSTTTTSRDDNDSSATGEVVKASLSLVTANDAPLIRKWYESDGDIYLPGTSRHWSEWWVKRCGAPDVGCEMLKLVVPAHADAKGGDDGDEKATTGEEVILGVAYYERNVVDRVRCSDCDDALNSGGEALNEAANAANKKGKRNREDKKGAADSDKDSTKGGANGEADIKDAKEKDVKDSKSKSKDDDDDAEGQFSDTEEDKLSSTLRTVRTTLLRGLRLNPTYNPEARRRSSTSKSLGTASGKGADKEGRSAASKAKQASVVFRGVPAALVTSVLLRGLVFGTEALGVNAPKHDRWEDFYGLLLGAASSSQSEDDDKGAPRLDEETEAQEGNELELEPGRPACLNAHDGRRYYRVSSGRRFGLLREAFGHQLKLWERLLQSSSVGETEGKSAAAMCWGQSVGVGRGVGESIIEKDDDDEKEEAKGDDSKGQAKEQGEAADKEANGEAAEAAPPAQQDGATNSGEAKIDGGDPMDIDAAAVAVAAAPVGAFDDAPEPVAPLTTEAETTTAARGVAPVDAPAAAPAASTTAAAAPAEGEGTATAPAQDEASAAVGGQAAGGVKRELPSDVDVNANAAASEEGAEPPPAKRSRPAGYPQSELESEIAAAEAAEAAIMPTGVPAAVPEAAAAVVTATAAVSTSAQAVPAAAEPAAVTAATPAATSATAKVRVEAIAVAPPSVAVAVTIAAPATAEPEPAIMMEVATPTPLADMMVGAAAAPSPAAAALPSALSPEAGAAAASTPLAEVFGAAGLALAGTEVSEAAAQLPAQAEPQTVVAAQEEKEAAIFWLKEEGGDEGNGNGDAPPAEEGNGVVGG